MAEVSEWNTNRCFDCEQGYGVVYMGSSGIHHYGPGEDSGRKNWRVCLNSKYFRPDVEKSKAIPSEEAVTEQMFFTDEPVFGYEGQKLTTQMRPSGLIEITSPVARKEPENIPMVPVGGLVNIKHTYVEGPPPIATGTYVRREKFNFAQGLELTRRPDKNGR